MVGGIFLEIEEMLGEDKYGPIEGAMWKRVNARFPNLYKALLEEPDRATRGAWLKRAKRVVSETG